VPDSRYLNRNKWLCWNSQYINRNTLLCAKQPNRNTQMCLRHLVSKTAIPLPKWTHCSIHSRSAHDMQSLWDGNFKQKWSMLSHTFGCLDFYSHMYEYLWLLNTLNTFLIILIFIYIETNSGLTKNCKHELYLMLLHPVRRQKQVVLSTVTINLYVCSLVFYCLKMAWYESKHVTDSLT
jgi:hypothetical protein